MVDENDSELVGSKHNANPRLFKLHRPSTPLTSSTTERELNHSNAAADNDKENHASTSANQKSILILPQSNSDLRHRRYLNGRMSYVNSDDGDDDDGDERPMPLVSTCRSGRWSPIQRMQTDFDTVYSEPTLAAAAASVLRGVHRSSIDATTTNLESLSSFPTESIPSRWEKYRKRLWQWLVDLVELGVLMRTAKGSTLYFIAIMTVIIRPISSILGASSYLIIPSIVLIQPVRPIGAHLEATVLSALALGLGIAYVAIEHAIGSSANAAQVRIGRSPSAGRWIAMSFFFTGVFWVTWIRVRFPRFSQSGHFAILPMVFGLTKGTAAPVFNPRLLYNICIPILLGIGLSLIVNILVFPTTASETRRLATTKTIKDIKNQLIQTANEFMAPSLSFAFNTPNQTRYENDISSNNTNANSFNDDDNSQDTSLPRKSRAERIKELIQTKEQMSLSVPSLVKLTKHAVYEVNIARHNPRDYKKLAMLLISIQQHLASMVLALQREEAWLQKEMEMMQMPLSRSARSTIPSTPEVEEMEENDGVTRSNQPSFDELRRHLGQISIRDRLEGRGDIVLLARMIDLTRDAVIKLVGACTGVLDSMNDIVEQDVFPGSYTRAFFCLLTSWLPLGGVRAHSETMNMEEGRRRQVQLGQTLNEALIYYDEAQKECVREIYSHIRSIGQREEHFLAFGFIYSLREIALKMRGLLELEPQFLIRRDKHQWKVWWPSVGIRKWMRRRDNTYDTAIDGGDYMEYAERLYESDKNETTNKQSKRQFDHWRKGRKHSSTARNVYDPVGGKTRMFIWRTVHWCQGYRVKFAFKMALCAFFISLTGYINEDTDAFFQRVHGQWALITALFVLSIDMGSTFLLGTFRLLGTIMATVWSIVVLVASDPDDPYLVTILLMIHGIICWRMVYHRKTLKFAIVSLLTATSTVLIYYSGVRYGQSALVLCLERGAGVLIGLLLCIALHQLVWPFFARSELRKLLSMVIHELGQTYSIISALRVLDYDDVQSPIIYEKAAKHIHSLQTRLVRANELLQAAAAEPRLKGPFPVDVYAQMIHVIRNSMAWLVSMRSAALQSHPANIRRVMAPNIAAHRDLGAAILLYYHVVAGSLRTKLPLPAYLPSARAARKIALHSSWLAFEPSGSRETDESLNEESSLVQQQQSHTENGNTSNTSPSYHEGPRTTDMCVVYWFAYSAGLSELIRGQERIGALVRKLVGVNELMAFHDDE